MSQPGNPRLDELRQIKVPSGFPVSRQLVDSLIADNGNPPANLPKTLLHVLASHLEVLNYMGQLEEIFIELNK
jgi:hypothetical protein